MALEHYILRNVNRSTCLVGGSPDPDDKELSKTPAVLSSWFGPSITDTSFVTVGTFDLDVDADTPGDAAATVQLVVGSTGGPAEYRYRVQAIDDESGCAVQDSSPWSAVYTTTGTKSDVLSLPAGVWSGATVLRLEIQLKKTGAMGSRSLTISVDGSTYSYVEVTWPTPAPPPAPSDISTHDGHSASVKQDDGDSAAVLQRTSDTAGTSTHTVEA